MARPTQDHLVVFLTFTGAAAAVLGQSESLTPLYRVYAASYSAGCMATLAILKRPGQQPPSTGGR